MRSLEAALASPTIPPDIVTTLLNLAEFMEHDEKALPLDTRWGSAGVPCCRGVPDSMCHEQGRSGQMALPDAQQHG